MITKYQYLTQLVMASPIHLLQWLVKLQEEMFVQLQLHPFISICAALFSILYLFSRIMGGWLRVKSANLPPSPPKIPIIGNLHLLGTLAHQSLRDLSQKYGALMLIYFGHSPVLVVSSSEMAAEIMKTHDAVFANRPFTTAAKVLFYGCTDVAFAPYGEHWRRIRMICVLELLSMKRVQNFKSVREEEIAIVIDKITQSCKLGNQVNIGGMVLVLTNSIISRCALGKKYEEDDNNRFGELTREVGALLGAFSFGDLFPLLGWMDILTGLTGKLKRTAQQLDSFYDQVIDEHLLHSKSYSEIDQEDDEKKDLIYILLQAQKDNPNLTRNNLKAIIMDIFVGGSDTSAGTIEWAMAELIRNPREMKITQDEVRRVVGNKSKVENEDLSQMEYLKCVVKETLRLHTPGPTLVPRVSSASVHIQGYDIPSTTKVLINAWAIHRDSNSWDNAEEFLPGRFINNTSLDLRGQDYHFIPFGSGRRGCPGISFALAVVELALANLLFWFDWELPSGMNKDDVDMTEAPGLTISKKDPLHLVPKSYFA